MEVNAWVQRSASNSIRYRAHQNPSFWPKQNSDGRGLKGRRQRYPVNFAVAIEGATGIGIAFVFFFRGDFKDS